jgi:hypothetical protein
LQGTTIKPLVKFLRVKTQEHHPKTVTDIFIANARDDMMAGIEVLFLQDLSKMYLTPLFIRQ